MFLKVPSLRQLTGPIFSKPRYMEGLTNSIYLGKYFSNEQRKKIDLYFRYYNFRSPGGIYIGRRYGNDSNAYVGKAVRYDGAEGRREHIEGVKRAEIKGLIVYDEGHQEYKVTEKGKGECS